MKYMIYVKDEDEQTVLLQAPLDAEDQRYFEQLVLPTLTPISVEDYAHSFAVILHSFARFSYILNSGNVYWCIEWDPGLIVVQFSCDGSLAWTAIRSPIPDFGGRTPLDIDLEKEDEDGENYQYNLIFNAWDAQFDEQLRVRDSFLPATEETIATFETALRTPNLVGEELQKNYSASPDEWRKSSKDNIDRWAGVGHILH